MAQTSSRHFSSWRKYTLWWSSCFGSVFSTSSSEIFKLNSLFSAIKLDNCSSSSLDFCTRLVFSSSKYSILAAKSSFFFLSKLSLFSRSFLLAASSSFVWMWESSESLRSSSSTNIFFTRSELSCFTEWYFLSSRLCSSCSVPTSSCSLWTCSEIWSAGQAQHSQHSPCPWWPRSPPPSRWSPWSSRSPPHTPPQSGPPVPAGWRG